MVYAPQRAITQQGPGQMWIWILYPSPDDHMLVLSQYQH